MPIEMLDTASNVWWVAPNHYGVGAGSLLTSHHQYQVSKKSQILELTGSNIALQWTI